MKHRKRPRMLPHARPDAREGADTEIRHHLAERADRLMAEGMDREEAEAEARRRFGDPEEVRRAMLVAGGPSPRHPRGRRPSKDLVLDLAQDVRLAARMLGRRPVFLVAAVLTLALAIAANATIFGIYRATLGRPLPFPDGERLMEVFVRVPRPDGTLRDISWSYPKYEVFRDRQDVFDALALFRVGDLTITGPEGAERIGGEIVSAGYVEMLGLSPVLGRAFLPEEDMKSDPRHVAMIGGGLWRRRFGSDPSVVGSTVRLNDAAYEIVGVLPAGFGGLTGGAEVWIPMALMSDLDSPGSHNKNLLARLRPGVSAEQATVAVQALGREVHQVYPEEDQPDAWGAEAVLLSEERMSDDIRSAVVFLFAAVGLLLLIACVNVANLLLARATRQRAEMALRSALGAGRGRLLRQLLLESGLVALLGGAVGIAASAWAIGIARRAAPAVARGDVFRSSLSGLTEMGLEAIHFDVSVVLFGAALTGATVLLFGLAPALMASRADLATALRAQGRGVGGRSVGVSSQRALVSAELALTFALAVGSGLMLRSMGNLLAQDSGFAADDVLSLRVVPARSEYDATGAEQLLNSLEERIRGIRGVQAVGRSSCVPLSGCSWGTTFRTSDAEPGIIRLHWINEHYLDALRIPLLRGRQLTEQDGIEEPYRVVVSEAAARRYWPGSDPLGKRIWEEQTAEVVGVVADVHYHGLEEEPEPAMYIPSARAGGVLADYYFVRSELDRAMLVTEVREILRQLDPNVPITEVQALEDQVAMARSPSRFVTGAMSLFGAVALILATVGVYGVVSFGVAERTHEIGVRMVLGARRSVVLWTVIRRALGMALLGIVVGTGLLVVSMGVLRSVLFGVEPFDPLTLLLTALLMAGATAAASYVPSRRAVAVDPVEALRAE